MPPALRQLNADIVASLRVAFTLRQLEVWEELTLSFLFSRQPAEAGALSGSTFREAVLGRLRNTTSHALLRGVLAKQAVLNSFLIAGATVPLDLSSPKQLASAMLDVATQVLHMAASPLMVDEALAVGHAGARLLDAMNASIPAQCEDRCVDVWVSVQEFLAQYQQVGIWLAEQTAALASGVLSATRYAEITATDKLIELASTETHNVHLGCMDTQAATFDWWATLNQPSACFYTDNDFFYDFLSMDAGSWVFFILSMLSALWLWLILLASIKNQLKVVGLRTSMPLLHTRRTPPHDRPALGRCNRVATNWWLVRRYPPSGWQVDGQGHLGLG